MNEMIILHTKIHGPNVNNACRLASSVRP